MATSYTSLLGLALPTTGELQGTWGDTVNNSITSLLDSAVAGTTTLSTDGDVTLSTTTGAANQARQAILLCSGARTAQRTITAPAQSKIYTVINNTTGGFAVKLVGVGPTTGVTIPAGTTAQVAWNGSDFVDVSGYVNGNLTVNGNVTVNGNTTLGDASGDSVTINAGTTTFVQGTANGVLYLNGSKVVTSGSALTFDGTNLTLGGTAVFAKSTVINALSGSSAAFAISDNATTTMYANNVSSGVSALWSSGALAFGTNNGTFSEQMRLTSTGLGIGTSSPSQKLTVVGNGLFSGGYVNTGGGGNGLRVDGVLIGDRDQNNNITLIGQSDPTLRIRTNSATVATFDSSGNLGLGVTPSAWNTYTALQVKTAALWSGNSLNSFASLTGNVYYQGGYKYIASDYATEYYQYQGAHVWRTAASGTAGNAITFTQAMTLTAAGRLGLGLTSPSTLFEAYGGAAGTSSELTVGNASTAARFGVDTSNEVTVATGQAVPIKFLTSNTERARIDSSGNLLVGATSLGLSNSNSWNFYIANNAILYGNHASGVGSGTSYVNFGYNGGIIGSITQSGTTAVAYNTSSDYRLKENIQPMTGALAKVAALKPCTYKWKADGSDGEGFIAHELAEIVPQCVTGEKDAVDEEGNPKYQGIDTSFLVATLTAAIQELKSEFDAYKATHP